MKKQKLRIKEEITRLQPGIDRVALARAASAAPPAIRPAAITIVDDASAMPAATRASVDRSGAA